MRTMQLLRLQALICCAPLVHAETRNVTAGGFEVVVRREVAAGKAEVFQAIGQIHRWWLSAHTWSGSADNLTLHLDAGGCFCERWGKGSAEHGRVIYIEADRVLRLRAALGPFLSMPVNAVLSFELAAAGDKTALQVTYSVAGAGQNLAPLARPVDDVITQQVDRLARFVATGTPDSN
jgi:uncharacterized protein YndB with AHSA1/START domain